MCYLQGFDPGGELSTSFTRLQLCWLCYSFAGCDGALCSVGLNLGQQVFFKSVLSLRVRGAVFGPMAA